MKKVIEILESDTPFVKKIYKAQKEKKFPNKKICHTLKKENVDYSLDYLIKSFLKYGYECYGNRTYILNLNMSRY